MENAGTPEIDSQTFEYKYEHFNHGEEKFKELRELAGYTDRGICWFAAIVMGIEALYPKKNQEGIIDELKDATFNLPREEGLRIFQDLREKGVDVSPFYKEGELKPLGSKKEGESFDFLQKYPVEYAALLNEMFSKKELGVKISFNKSLTDYLDSETFIKELQEVIKRGGVPLLPVNYTDEDKEVHPHIVMVGGISPWQIKLSDSNDKNPVFIPTETISKLINEGVKFDGNTAQYNSAVGIIVIEKN